MVSKANRNLMIIRRTFHHLDKDVLIPLYKSMVKSHLEYGVDGWSPKLKRNIQSIGVQRRATKLIPGFEDLSYEERLTELKLSTMVYRRKRGEMIQERGNDSGLQIASHYLGHSRCRVINSSYRH